MNLWIQARGAGEIAGMGSVLNLQNATPEVEIRVRVYSEKPLARVIVFRNGEVWKQVQLHSSDRKFESKWKTKEANAASFFMRVEQKDGEAGWTSPVFIQPE
jgi:hypothetical protein